MRERIGILTGGGDCPGLNTVIRAVVKCATKRGWDTIGFLDGFEGLLEPLRYRALDYKEMDALLFVGGTVLGTSNNGRFAAKTGHGESNRIPREILVEWAAAEIRNEYRRILDREDLKLLRKVAENNRLEYNERLRPLLQLLALLEYRDGENWCDVHPVLRKLLHE